MQHLILKGCVMITSFLLISAGDLHTTTVEFSLETPAIAGTSSAADTHRRASSEELTDMAEDTGPANVALSSDVASSSKVASIEGPLSTVPSIGEESAGTSSIAVKDDVQNMQIANPDDSKAEHSQRDVVVIAVCVSLLSLIVIILSVAMTILIRRRMRQKAYLRVKHASQTELAVHYVQNTQASAAARDLLMEQLFESLASMDADGPNDFQIAYSSDDQCLTPTESIASELVAGKNRICSRSMPSLKNLNAHEEALNCNFSFVANDVTGKGKGRSRSFTEKTLSGVRVDAVRGKNALRSHSEKAKNRLAVSLLTPGKRFEKKKDKSNRRSTPSISRFAKFNILRGQTSKQKTTNAEEQAIASEQTISTEQTPPTQIATQSYTHVFVDTGDLAQAKCYSASLSDFEIPNVSPILQDMKPMLTAFQMNGRALQGPKSAAEADDSLVEQDIKIFRDIPLSNHRSTSTDKAASLEEVSGEYLCRKGKASSRIANALLSTRRTKTPQASRSVNDLDEMRTTVV